MTEIKRLVILSGSYPQICCGAAGHAKLIAERTAALNRFDVHVLTAADKAVDPSLAKGYIVHPTVESFSPFAAGKICQDLLKRDPDIVHIQNLTVKYTGWRSVVMSQVARKLKKLKPNIRLVVVQHDIADGLAVTDIFVSLPDRGADMRNTSIHTAMLAQLPVVTLQNEGYYIDKQIAERGCYTVDSPGAHRLCEKILEVYQSPPSGQFRQQLAAWLDPERIWQQHIETNLRTYEGKPPESLAAFNTG